MATKVVRIRRRRTGRQVSEREFIESLKLNVSDPNTPGDYVRIGPGHPLYQDELAKNTAQAARNGDTDAALEVLRDFVGAIDQYDEHTWHGLRSAPIHWAYVQYIAAAFEKIIRAHMRKPTWSGAKWDDVETGDAEANANLALGIKNSKAGRRRGARTHNEEALAAAFNLLLINGLKPEQAKRALREHTGADKRTIEKANNKHIAYQMYARRLLKPRTSTAAHDRAAEIIKVGAVPYQKKVGEILKRHRTRKPRQ